MAKYYDPERVAARDQADKARVAARDQANEKTRKAAEQKEQARVDKVRANTMPVGSVKRAGSLLPNSMLKEKKTLGGGLTPNLRTMPAPSGGEKKDLPKKKKDPIVSEKEFKEFNKSGGKTLRDFMNAKQYDEATGKFVDRAKALTRREDKRSDAKALPVTYSAKKGGSVSSRGDGIAQRGKTRGKMC